MQPRALGQSGAARQDLALPWADVLLSASFFKDHLYGFSRTECVSSTQYQGLFGGQVHATHFFIKIILAQVLYLKVCTQSEPLAAEPCMYLQEWLSVPVCSLLGINLVGNHDMVEVVGPPESILLFSSFEFSWVRLGPSHGDVQVAVLPWRGEAHGGSVGRVPPFSSAVLSWFAPCLLPRGLQMNPQPQGWGWHSLGPWQFQCW